MRNINSKEIMETAKKREYDIANLRAIAILLVMLGHSIIIYSSAWSLGSIYSSHLNYDVYIFDYLKTVINIIQMPLFISLSGYFFFYTNQRRTTINFKSILINKAKRLLVPYVLISLFWLIPIRFAIGYKPYISKSIINVIIYDILMGNDNGHLWFLPTLFIISICAYILCNFFKHINHKGNWLFDAIIFVILCLLSRLSNKFAYTHLIFSAQFSIWFYLGFLINKYKWNKLELHRVVLVCTQTFCIFLIIMAIIKNSWILTTIASIMLTIDLYLIVPSKTNKVLSTLDKGSYGMYLFHSPMVYISFTYYPDINPFMMLIVNLFGFGFVAFVLTELCRRINLKFILGE